MKNKRIVVIGTSAGGPAALKVLLGGLPRAFPAPIFVVQHLPPDGSAAVLAAALDDSCPLPCSVARNGERFAAGRVYVAPADNHLLVKERVLIVTKGARENRNRPAIDPLFRSAAVAHGPAVISIVLTGRLDDGTEGTAAVKRCGGITVVEDPSEAAYPDMPRSAAFAKVAHTVPLAKMSALLVRLVRTAVPVRKPVPDDVRIEATIAERVLSDVRAVNVLGSQVPYNCPGCGGVLWQVEKSKTLRFRCHVGHSLTAKALLVEQSSKIEETLWMTLRMLEERRNLLRAMNMRHAPPRSAVERVDDTEVHIERIRQLLTGGRDASASKARPRPVPTVRATPKRARRRRGRASE